MPYIVTAPCVIVRDEDGVQHYFYESAQLPASGLDSDHLKQLVEEKMVEKVAGSTADVKPAKVEDILAEVGDDKEKAAAALEEEKAGKNRKTLVEPLEALLAKE